MICVSKSEKTGLMVFTRKANVDQTYFLNSSIVYKRILGTDASQYTKLRGYNVHETWECESWEHFRTDSSVKNHVKTKFLYKRPLSADSLVEKNKERISFWLYAMQFNSSRRVEAHIFIFSCNIQK